MDENAHRVRRPKDDSRTGFRTVLQCRAGAAIFSEDIVGIAHGTHGR